MMLCPKCSSPILAEYKIKTWTIYDADMKMVLTSTNQLDIARWLESSWKEGRKQHWLYLDGKKYMNIREL